MYEPSLKEELNPEPEPEPSLYVLILVFLVTNPIELGIQV